MTLMQFKCKLGLLISFMIFSTLTNAQTRLQSATGNTGTDAATTMTVTLGNAPQNGNTLIAVISGRTTTTNNISSITQSGVTWVKAVSRANTVDTNTEIWYTTAINNAGTAITITQGSARSAAVIMEYSGLLYAAPLDQVGSNANGSNSSSASTGTTATTTSGPQLWIGGIGLRSSGFTLSSITIPFSEIDNAFSTNATAGINARVYALECRVTTVGAASTGGTISSNSRYSGAIATFKRLVTGFTPDFLCDASRTVTITGEGFTGATAVNFNGTPASSFTVNSNTQITATAPAAATSGLISVTNSSGRIGYSESPLIIRKMTQPTANTTNTTCPVASDGALMLTNIPIALNFNATQSQHVNLGTSLLNNLTGFTLEGWIKTTSYNRNSFFGQDNALELGFAANGSIELWSEGLNTSLYTGALTYPRDGEWHHVAGVGNGQNMSIYIDGVLVAQRTHNALSAPTNYGSSTATTRIGGFVWSTGTPNYFNGQMLKVGFWNRALTSQEIVNLASQPYQYSGSDNGLIAGYNFFEGTGTSLSRIPTGGSGTITGSPASIWTDISTYSWTKQGGGFAASTKNISGIGTGTYDLSVTIGGCATNTNSFAVGSNGTESTPATSISGNSPVCAGSQVVLTLNAGTLGTAASWKWYSGACGTNEITTGITNGGRTLTVTPSTTTTYYARAEGTCNTTACVSYTVVVNTAGTWLGTTNTDWNTASNWCGGIPTSTTDAIIPTTPIGNRFPVVGSTGAVCKTLTIETGASVTMGGAYSFNIYGNWTNNGTFSPSTSTVAFKASGTVSGTSTTTFHNLTIHTDKTLTGSSATMNITGHWTNNGTFSNNGGTVVLNGTTAQDITGVTVFNNLTINNAAGVVGKSNLTVNGVLNLASDSPDETKGTIEMTVDYASYSNVLTETANLTTTKTQTHDILNSNILYMGANASTIGIGDVTGKVKRTTINENVEYSFGNPNSTITFNGNGDNKLPTAILFVITKGSNRGIHANKTNTVARLYQVIRTGGDSPTSFTLKLHYKDSELNGNTEGNLVLWDHHIPYSNANTPHEHGKTSQNSTDNWVELSGHGIGYLGTQEEINGSTKYWMFGNTLIEGNKWLGAVENDWTNWNNSSNWTKGNVPTCSDDVIIDNTPYSPVIPSTGANARTIEILSGATLVGSDGVLTICGGIATNGGKSSWANNGTFNQGTSTVKFNYPRTSNDETSTISGNANFYNMEVSTGTIMVLQAGSSTTVSNKVTQNGSIDARTFNNTFIYNGSNAQTVVNPAIGSGYHNLTLSGSGTKTLPASNVNIAGNLLLDAALVSSSNTITFNGITPQTLSGTSASALNNVTLNNANGLTLSKSQKVDGTLTLTNGLITTGSNVLSLGCNASTSGQSSSSYVNGILARDYCGIGAKLFPIGKGGAYRPLNIERTTGASGLTSIQSEQFEATITGILPANTTAFANRFWTITQPAGTESYKIQIDGTDFTPNGTAVILKGNGNAQSTLTSLAATTPNYTTLGAISSFGDFTLGSECLPPTINIHPSAQTACELSVDAVTFTVTPEAGTYTYSWEVNTGSGWATVSNGGVYSNATTASLSITSPTYSMDGYAYRALVARDCGGIATSNAATLTVNPQPQGSLSGQTNICKGSVGSLTWTIPEGTGSFDITYKIGESGTPILLENVASGVSFQVGAISENTIFNLVSVKDRSTNCTRTAGFTQGSAEITVNPYITWTGATDTDWFKASNWCGGVPTLTDDVIIPDVTNEPVIAGAGAVTKSMIIDNNSSVTINGAYTLKMAGNLTNNGLLDTADGTLDIVGFIENNGTINTKNTLPLRESYGGNIILSGTSTQTLNGGTYNNVIVENTAGVVLASNAIVNAQGTLEIKSGTKLEIGTGRSVIANNVDNKAGTSGILIRAAQNEVNGSLVFNNTIEKPVEATVQMYSPGYWTGTTTKTYYWQFMGIPVTKIGNVDPTFYGAFVRKYNEPGWGVTGDATNAPVKRWIQLFNGNSMYAVAGYELVQPTQKVYTISGSLFNADIDTTLSYTTRVTNISGQFPGQHILSNPYTSAIRISDIIFGHNMDSTVYLYNTGSFGQWEATLGNKVGSSAGQYIAAPIKTAGTGGIPNEIPSMQGFLVRTNRAETGSLYINYNNVKTRNTTMQRARKAPAPWLRLNLQGATTDGDVMWMFVDPETTAGHDNGWDAIKIASLSGTPMLHSINETGRYQINAVPDIHNTDIEFRAGTTDSQYKITIDNENIENTYQKIYLFDIETGVITDISESGTEYEFNTSTKTLSVRFRILTALPSTTATSNKQDNAAVNIFSSDNYIFIDNRTNKQNNFDVFDQTGRKVTSFASEANSLLSIKTSLVPGVYIVRRSSADETESTRILIR